jgi:hypothetical protein
MYAISLWQPWASFIAIGVKPYETRSWRAPPHIVGQRIAIHAAKRPVSRDDLVWWREIAGSEQPLAFGAIVCTAILENVFRAQDVPEDDYGDYAVGRSAWKLSHVLPVDPPFPVKGQQGFWRVPEIVT